MASNAVKSLDEQDEIGNGKMNSTIDPNATPEVKPSSQAPEDKEMQVAAASVVNDAIFEVKADELVFVKDIEIYSLCGHHLVPFMGKIHIGYVPRGRIIGLSKLARIAEIFSRRLQVQEQLTQEVAQAIDDVLNPEGVAMVVECVHMCMAMRGMQKKGTMTITQSKTGVFREHCALNDQFHSLLTLTRR
ncbi:GTP cyclohydrolase 1 [Penicillium taxi]|uniref:GTP cyclohydrolase 1 n=1 Tax=Penicillium taxi TaxID=168475 RepID=UPI0025450A02|nr:GTP cyclohydrolase 1 [Penicillium taxi]KAJ5893402.1 GTP cyclohydrolase 1 [Penicillium taxi]